MSIDTTLVRVLAIRQALADPASLIGSSSTATGGTEAPASGETANASSSFAAALAQASVGEGSPAAGLATAALPTSLDQALATPGSLASADSASAAYPYSLQGIEGIAGSPTQSSQTGAGNRIAAIAESQIGQAEQPPGSNESPAIATYRGATAGAIPGAPWCAYFASWAAREVGEPIGSSGEGLGSVSEIWSWAQSSGRAVPNGPGVVPKPGDLIVFGDEHVGIVKGVLPNGQIATIEGNYENKVAANVRSSTEATGYVSMS
jgi:hypothetical protein